MLQDFFIEESILKPGQNSRVLLCRERQSLELVTVKEYNQRNAAYQAAFELELCILRETRRHRNLVRLRSAFQDSIARKSYLVLEYIAFPTLSQHLTDFGGLNETASLAIYNQIAQVVTYLASWGVVHRDIKSDNVMFNPKTLMVKVIDLGLASTHYAPGATSNLALGTPLYWGPEILDCVAASSESQVTSGSWSLEAAEVYSLGMLLWECLLGHHPYHFVQSTRELRRELRRAKPRFTYSPEMNTLLENLLCHDAASRPSFNQLLDLIWSPNNEKKGSSSGSSDRITVHSADRKDTEQSRSRKGLQSQDSQRGKSNTQREVERTLVRGKGRVSEEGERISGEEAGTSHSDIVYSPAKPEEQVDIIKVIKKSHREHPRHREHHHRHHHRHLHEHDSSSRSSRASKTRSTSSSALTSHTAVIEPNPSPSSSPSSPALSPSSSSSYSSADTSSTTSTSTNASNQSPLTLRSSSSSSLSSRMRRKYSRSASCARNMVAVLSRSDSTSSLWG